MIFFYFFIINLNEYINILVLEFNGIFLKYFYHNIFFILLKEIYQDYQDKYLDKLS